MKIKSVEECLQKAMDNGASKEEAIKVCIWCTSLCQVAKYGFQSCVKKTLRRNPIYFLQLPFLPPTLAHLNRLISHLLARILHTNTQQQFKPQYQGEQR